MEVPGELVEWVDISFLTFPFLVFQLDIAFSMAHDVRRLDIPVSDPDFNKFAAADERTSGSGNHDIHVRELSKRPNGQMGV